jgi:glutathione S-transferase
MAVELYGYQFSVYSWIARLALEEKGVDYHWIEVDLFVQSVPVSYLALHPFKRVPTLVHDSFQLYETGAITRYIDEAFPGPSLQPTDAAIALAAASSSLSLTATSTGHWCDKYFHIVSFAHASGDLRMTRRYKRVWRQRPRCSLPWSGLLLTLSISAVPNYHLQTSTSHR